MVLATDPNVGKIFPFVSRLKFCFWIFVIFCRPESEVFAQPNSLTIANLPPVENVSPPAPIATAMSLADLENIALQNNPSIAESFARVNALRGKWEQVGLAPNPYAGYSGQQVGSGNTVEQRGVVFGQELVMGSKLTLNRAVVNQEIQQAEQQLIIQKTKVLTDVRIGYYEVLTAQQKSRLAQEIAQFTSNTVSLAQKRIESKEGSKIEFLQAKIEFESSQVLKQRSQNQYVEAWRKLTAVMGSPDLPFQPLHGKLDADLPTYDWNSSLQRLICSSPEIATAQLEIQRTRWAYQRAMAEKTSNISFQGVVQDDRSINATNGAVQVTLPIPLWNKNQGAITQAGHESLAAENALHKLELDLQRRLAIVFQRYDSARSQVERYTKEILPSAQQNLDLTHQAYRAGEFSGLQLLLAQRTYSETHLDYLNSLYELRTASLEIEGLLLTNSLQATTGN